MSEYSSIFYKADQRTSEVSDGHSSFLSLQKPFGDLVRLDDVYLLPGQEECSGTIGTHRLIVPVTGVLSYRDSESTPKYLMLDEVLFPGNEKENLLVKNPYEKDTINFLSIGLHSSHTELKKTTSYPLRLDEFNKLTSLHANKINEDCYAGVGLYKGRTKGRYTLKDTRNGIFAYVINGAFEVEERLMEHRDGLALWDVKHIEFESLSEFAILLILEIPQHEITN